MSEKRTFTPPVVVGAVSLLTIFAVLCLTVFALLSLSTVQADERLSDKSFAAVEGYYAADCAAEEILAQLRTQLCRHEQTVLIIQLCRVFSDQSAHLHSILLHLTTLLLQLNTVYYHVQKKSIFFPGFFKILPKSTVFS